MSGLSVLTLARGRSAHLDNLVEGLRRSATPPDELVIVDMNDAPLQLVSAPFKVRIERIDLAGLPLAAARNRAAALARNEALLFLDADCIPARGLVGDMTEALGCHDALVCAEVLYLGPGDARGSWQEDDLLAAGAGHPVRPFPASGLVRETNYGLFWSLAFGLRRRRFEALGGFDEAFVGYGGEDTDLGFTARAAETPLLFMAGPGAFHQHHPVSNPPLEHLDDILRNAAVFRAKWGIWPMEGWLRAFEEQGLIALDEVTIADLRSAGQRLSASDAYRCASPPARPSPFAARDNS